jgi:hypothetical protein
VSLDAEITLVADNTFTSRTVFRVFESGSDTEWPASFVFSFLCAAVSLDFELAKQFDGVHIKNAMSRESTTTGRKRKDPKLEEGEKQS